MNSWNGRKKNSLLSVYSFVASTWFIGRAKSEKTAFTFGPSELLSKVNIDLGVNDATSSFVRPPTVFFIGILDRKNQIMFEANAKANLHFR